MPAAVGRTCRVRPGTPAITGHPLYQTKLSHPAGATHEKQPLQHAAVEQKRANRQ